MRDIVTEVDELNQLDSLIRISRECEPDDEGKTVIVYKATDGTVAREPRQLLATFRSHCHREVLEAVNYTLKCFGSELAGIPYDFIVSVERISDDSKEGSADDPAKLWLVRLLEFATHQCHHHFEHPSVCEAIDGFWDGLDFEAISTAAAVAV
jgi:hypothetical protein